VIEANTNANATQFLSNGTVRLSPTGTTQIVSGTSDGSQLELSTNAALSQVRGGNVVVQVGTSGSVTKTWTFAQDGSLYTPGNINVTNIVSNVLTANTAVNIGNTSIAWGTFTTNTITANQTIGSFSVSNVTGVEFLVKAIDATGSKYSVATVQAVTDGSNVDYSTYGTVNLGGQTGVLAVNVVSGNVKLEVTPASTNTTVWTTQVRFI
jgi:hypothetical protein